MNKVASFKNFVFISYSHADKKSAEELQKVLDEFHLPVALKEKYPDRPEILREIFRDDTGLPAGSNLTKEIQKQLDQSNYLVVICSPNAVKSQWVNKEIEYFKIYRDPTHIIPFIIEGVANAKEDSDEECFPSALKSLEARGANISTFSFERAVIEVIAGALVVDVDDLWQRHVRAEEERKRKLQEQRDNLLRIQSRFLAEKAHTLCLNQDYDKACLLAIEALPISVNSPDRPFVKEAEIVLREAMKDKSPIVPCTFIGAIDLSGVLIAVIDRGFRIKIWDINYGNFIKTLQLDKLIPEVLDSYQKTHNTFNTISFIERDRRIFLIVSTSNHIISENQSYSLNSVYLIDIDSEDTTCVFEEKDDCATIHSVNISPSCDYMIVRCQYSHGENAVFRSRIFNFEKINLGKLEHVVSCHSASFSEDNRYSAVSDGRYLFVCEIKSNNYIFKTKCLQVIDDVFFLKDDLILFRCGNSLYTWAYMRDEIDEIYVETLGIDTIISNQKFVVWRTSSGLLKAFDVDTNIVFAVRVCISVGKPISFTPDGKGVLFMDGNSIRIWDLFSLNDSEIQYWHPTPIFCASYSYDHKHYVSYSNGCVKIWDASAKKLEKTIRVDNIAAVMGEKIPEGIAIDNNCRTVILSFYETSWLINVDYSQTKQIQHESCSVWQISPDGKWISTEQKDKNQIFISDVENDNENIIITLPDNQCLWGITNTAFCQGGNMIVSKSIDEDPEQKVLYFDFWDVLSGNRIKSFSIQSDDNLTCSDIADFYDDEKMIILKDEILDGKSYAVDVVNEKIITDCDTVYSLCEKELYFHDKYVLVPIPKPSLQNLINEARRRFEHHQLTLEERKKYYLD